MAIAGKGIAADSNTTKAPWGTTQKKANTKDVGPPRKIGPSQKRRDSGTHYKTSVGIRPPTGRQDPQKNRGFGATTSRKTHQHPPTFHPQKRGKTAWEGKEAPPHHGGKAEKTGGGAPNRKTKNGEEPQQQKRTVRHTSSWLERQPESREMRVCVTLPLVAHPFRPRGGQNHPPPSGKRRRTGKRQTFLIPLPLAEARTREDWKHKSPSGGAHKGGKPRRTRYIACVRIHHN